MFYLHTRQQTKQTIIDGKANFHVIIFIYSFIAKIYIANLRRELRSIIYAGITLI